MLARDCARGVELREVDLWRDSAIGIDPPDNHMVLLDCDTLHNLLVLLDVQKCVDFCALRHQRLDAEWLPAYTLLALG